MKNEFFGEGKIFVYRGRLEVKAFLIHKNF